MNMDFYMKCESFLHLQVAGFTADISKLFYD